MDKVQNGIDRLQNESDQQNKISGNIALLCHSASVDENLKNSIEVFKEIYGERLIKVFGPQHGFVSDVQDNMIETDHYKHPYFNLPIYSLYSETRKPTPEMLKDINTFVIDLQDVGTRVYTYITTMTYILKACAKENIKVVILDRPNPVSGKIIEGPILKESLLSFVGCMPIPQRHSLTMGEMAKFAKDHFNLSCELEVITMKNWKREMFWDDTGLEWINPSPNLPTWQGSLTFAGTVLFEGTNISEGRGTTRSLEVIGHPSIEPYSFVESIKKEIESLDDSHSFTLRPTVFMPTFQKHTGAPCGGVHIHIKDKKAFKSWRLSQLLCQKLYHHLGNDFEWVKKAYEYEYEKLPIDLINGDEAIRTWVENNDSIKALSEIENNTQEYKESIKKIYLYE